MNLEKINLINFLENFKTMKKNILFIGGSTGIGLETIRLVQHDYNVYVASRNKENLKDLNSIEVSLVWEPKWHKDLMSEEAKLALDIF